MNQERPIERLLRRYAQKRQTETGAPLEMPPATRQRLRAELSRRFGDAPERPPALLSAWARFWQGWGRRLAWAAPVVVAAGVIVRVLHQENPDTRTRPETAQPAATTTDKSALASTAESPAPVPSRSAEPFGRAGVETAAPVVAESFKALESPRPPPEVAAEGDIGTAVRSLWEVAPPAQAALADEAAAARKGSDATKTPSAPAGALAAGSGSSAEVGNGHSQAFVNTLAAASSDVAKLGLPAARQASQSAVATSVLTRFRLVQAQNQIRVVDADGSVYVVEPVPESGADRPGPAPSTAGGLVASSSGQALATRETRPVPAIQQTAESVAGVRLPAFRAVGTNRSLDQPVEFVWSFAPLTNHVGAARLVRQSPQPPADHLMRELQLPVPPSVGVVGRARIGNIQEIEVRAVPEKSQ